MHFSTQKIKMWDCQKWLYILKQTTQLSCLRQQKTPSGVLPFFVLSFQGVEKPLLSAQYITCSYLLKFCLLENIFESAYYYKHHILKLWIVFALAVCVVRETQVKRSIDNTLLPFFPLVTFLCGFIFSSVARSSQIYIDFEKLLLI